MEFSREEKTSTPRTMSEIEWDDTQHRFAGAEAEDGHELVMLERRWVEGPPDLYVIMCVDLEGRTGLWTPGHITPTGRRFRLVLETTDSPIEPVFDPDYIYRDIEGDKWECLGGRWFIGDNHAERVAGSRNRFGIRTPPDRWGPYTRIKKEESNE